MALRDELDKISENLALIVEQRNIFLIIFVKVLKSCNIFV